MRVVYSISLMLLMVAATARAAAGDDAAARATIQSATRNAVNNLLDEVSSTRLTRNVSVGEFARRTGSTDELVKVLQRAQQLGGPRWVDDDHKTCQIELQISGAVVGQALRRAAAANPKGSPISLAEVTRIVKDWDERSFTATGAATSRVPVLNGNNLLGGGGGGGGARRPRGGGGMGLQLDPWWNVGEDAKAEAVAAAKADAARRSLASVRPIALTPKSTVGDVLAVRDVGEGMQRWFVAQPAAHVELLDDLRAEVELAVTPAETFRTFRVLATKQTDVPVPADDKGWLSVRDAFEKRMDAPVGRGVVPAKAVGGNDVIGVPRAKRVDLPARAPAWAVRRLEATGKGQGRTKLAAARAAEADAEAKIRTMVEDLALTEKTSVGRAAKDDPRVAQAVKRALARTRIGRADYHADGSADVAVYLELGDLWEELRGAE